MKLKSALLAVACALPLSATMATGAFAAQNAHHASHAASKDAHKTDKHKTSVQKDGKHKTTVPVWSFAHATLTAAKGFKDHGTATLKLDTATHELFVTVDMVDLTPGSKHPDHLHHDVNGRVGGIAYALQTLVANKKGDAEATTVIKGVDLKAIPSHFWFVNVHQGPTMSGKGMTPIATGLVVPGGKK
ncbi:MAG: CHRD domain-containing protein [Firmicutes bacterium]|nr:CHRD domain-containing protein [Bacillota bacterium]